MVPALDVTIALAEQYNAIMFEKNKTSDKNKSKQSNNKSSSMTMYLNNKANKPDDMLTSDLGSTR